MRLSVAVSRARFGISGIGKLMVLYSAPDRAGVVRYTAVLCF